MIPVHVISLAHSHERRAFMQGQLDSLGISFRFFDAIDGSKMSDSQLMTAAPKGGVEYCGLLTPGEIGAALSHLAIIREIAEGEHSYAAVIEDDVGVTKEARTFFDERVLRLLPPFGVLQLGNGPQRSRLALKVGSVRDHEVFASPRCSFSMPGLIYTREAARMIATSISVITAPIDNMIFRERRPFGLTVVEIVPRVVQHNDNLRSEIGLRPRPKGLSKLGRELRRLRNSARMWCSFVYAWGFSGLVRLRPG